MRLTVCDQCTCFLCKNSLPEWKEAIIRKKQTFYFKKGERIFSEGDKVEGIFFLYSGAVKIHKQWQAEKELIIRFSAKGDLIGHRGLGVSQRYPVSATSLEGTELCFIATDFLESTLRTNQGFTYKLMEYYADELQRAESRMLSLNTMEAKARIASTLLEMDTLFGRDAQNYIAIPIARQDIASYSGTTYETVFKALKAFLREGLIQCQSKSIAILNEQGLRAIIKPIKS